MTIIPLKPKDARAAARQAKKRAKSKPIVTPPAGARVTTTDICGFAGRLSAGHVTGADAELASRLLMGLVTLLPRDGSLMLPDACPYVGLTAPKDTETQPKIANSGPAESPINASICVRRPDMQHMASRMPHSLVRWRRGNNREVPR
jgi:hypothetical protein